MKLVAAASSSSFLSSWLAGSRLPVHRTIRPTVPLERTWRSFHTFCHYSGEQLQTLIAQNVTGVHYIVKPMCVETQIVKENCVNQQKCAAPPDTFKYMVFRSEDGGPYAPWGTVCLGADEADQLGALTPARVQRDEEARLADRRPVIHRPTARRS